MDKAVFLDRDGVINQDLGSYIAKPEDFFLLEGVIEALKKLYESEYKMIVITNQGGIGKGDYTEEDFHNITKKMYGLLEQEGIKLDGLYYCPHHPDSGCNCRKPKLGLLEKAVEDHDISLKESFFIGDKTSDIKAGKDAGCKTFLVKTGCAGRDNLYDVEPDFIKSDLLDAVNTILK